MPQSVQGGFGATTIKMTYAAPQRTISVSFVTSNVSYTGFVDQRSYSFHLVDPAVLTTTRWAILF
jgi:hypothetical protein